MPMPFFHTLIRTHHITSRKKVAHLRKAADQLSCYALLRTGGSPGLMYCKGSEEAVREWVSTVQRLRYMDFRLLQRPVVIETMTTQPDEKSGLVEVETVKEFAAAMEQRKLTSWWKTAMEWAS
ncbi:hypothetical protein B0H63DRAFT_480006 [Podospora didyma]|uniref:Uncharacterized protein n=1 Tax=Podospora didyma TaxID=330526 RepID=A0AAE0KL48_9PEZI|nr:hypothetical protein B0H63DRAFT_480006 [Podospora didyma]